jgi:DNA-binding CsgD family transcriptional regulator
MFSGSTNSAVKSEMNKMMEIWDKLQTEITQPVPSTKFRIDEIVSSVFAMGPFYYYLLHPEDMSISNISSDFEAMHGIGASQVNHVDYIFSLIHPDDLDFLAKAEEQAHYYILGKGIDKLTRYKISYNLRFRVADGTYRLFNHQSLVLSVDNQTNTIVKSINIHTDISHLTQKNNYKWSALGLMGEPSFLNLDVECDSEERESARRFSKRELEILRMIAEGLSTKVIADALFITSDTVKVHRRNIMAKSGCTNMAELAARSISEGWI